MAAREAAGAMQNYKYDKAIAPESKNGGSPALNNNPRRSGSKRVLLIGLDLFCLFMGERRPADPEPPPGAVSAPERSRSLLHGGRGWVARPRVLAPLLVPRPPPAPGGPRDVPASKLLSGACLDVFAGYSETLPSVPAEKPAARRGLALKKK